MPFENQPISEVKQLRQRIAELESQLSEVNASSLAGLPTRGGETMGVEQLRVIFDNYAGGMVFSRNGIIIDANAGLARILRTTVDKIIGRPIIDFIAEEDRPLVRKHVEQGIISAYEHSICAVDGTKIPVEVTAGMVKSDGPRLRFSVISDISDRKRTQEDLECQRLLLQAILDCVPAGIFVVQAPSGKPVLVNQYSRKLLRKTEIRDVPLDQFAAEYSAYIAGTDQLYPENQFPIVRGMQGVSSQVDDIELRFADGTKSIIQVNGAPIYDASGKISMSVAVSQDITDRKRAEEKIHAEQDFLRVLIRANERDRQLMAYEIHDGLVQYITAAVWHLDSVADTASLDSQSLSALNKAQQLLRQSIGEARRVLSGLRPPILDEQGVVVAVQYLAAESQIPGKLEVETSLDVDFRRLDPRLEGAVFRIVQESLSNIRKHSEATHAIVRMSQTDTQLQLSIEDNGCGFQVAHVSRDRFGLQGIRKRVELLNGHVQIESGPGQGTRISVELPFLAELDPETAF